MVSLDFQVTYNQNGILSVHVMAEGCGAYCTRYTDYFNYSTVNGKWLRIADVIEHSSEFKSRVNRDQKEQLLAQKNELKNMLNDPDSGVDEPTYKWALEYYEDCEEYADLETFALYPDRIEIIQDCALPNAIKNLKPTIKLMYDVNDFGVDWKLKK
jgi:hypothetical protein